MPEPITLERFKELSDGDSESLIELLELYLSKTAEQMAELDQAVTRQASKDISRIAHSMTGANAMVGMTTLLPLLRNLEEQADQQAVSKAKDTFHSVRNEFQKIETFLKKYMTTLR